MNTEEEDQSFVDAFKATINAEVNEIDQSIMTDADLRDHYRQKYHNQYLYNTEGDAVAQIFVEKTSDDYLRISRIASNKVEKLTPHMFDKMLKSSGYSTGS